MNLDLSKIDNVSVDGIDTKDYPDFTDAYIDSADYDGREMTEDEIDWLNENERDFVYECVMKKLFKNEFTSKKTTNDSRFAKWRYTTSKQTK